MAPELVCQIMGIYVLYLYINDTNARAYNEILRLLELIIFLRIIKLLSLMMEIEQLKIVMETAKNLAAPLISLAGILITIIYLFALMGILFFGGIVTKDNPKITFDDTIPDSYHLMNFNDLLSSFVTLFCLMCVNNWMVIANMYVKLMGDKTYWRFFFSIYFFFSVIIGINIVVAFAIDMY